MLTKLRFPGTGLIASLLAVGVLGGCGGLQLERAKKMDPQGSEFNVALYQGYVNLAGAEYDEADFRDSDAFAMRAMTSGEGQTVDPEAISQRRLPEDTVSQLTSAYDQLVSALGNGADQKAPADAAKAQVMFDCWMQEQEEDIQPEDIAACRAGFYAAMAAVKIALAPKMAAAAPAPAPMPAPAPKPMPLTGPYTVFFDFDSAELTAAAPAVVQMVISDFEKVKPNEIRLSGHADRAGSSGYNMILSKERLDAVAAALKAAGVPSLILTKTIHGEYDPREATPDGQRSDANRRVEVVFKR